ncbi:DUF6233 domain-containing protein [Streptomyces sp. NPDC014734]|uniref:DUF6233 domain-containing protein n=1 Tax=Streptomyces sp. NPDC014734 TaxID=3364886 RepID=UPI0036FA0D3E
MEDPAAVVVVGGSVHRGDCAPYPVEGGFLDQGEAVIALADPDIEACQTRRPETGLADG